MPFDTQLKETVYNYATIDLPNDIWYDINFFTFIDDDLLRKRLIVEHRNARIIYKIFEGLQAKDDLLLAQIKTQVIMYVSIQEAAISYVLFNIQHNSTTVKLLLNRKQKVAIDVPTIQKEKLKELFIHNDKELFLFYDDTKKVDITKIRYDSKIKACLNLKLISKQLADDLILLYEYRNTIHLEAELKKGFNYNLEMAKLAYRRVEGLNLELSRNLE